MYSAMNIAKWFVNRAAQDVADNGGEYLTHLKLQKLLYYAQGANLALRGDPVFSDMIEKWTHGPVVPSVYRYYKQFKAGVIDIIEPVEIDNETQSVLEQVYEVFGAYSALKLREMTHNETPWQTAEQNNIISNEVIKSYFINNYIQD